MHPGERVRFAVETAKAVLEERLTADEGAAAIKLQAEQVTPLLRGDRDNVTRSESESVATQLRLLAEQVNDRGSASRRTTTTPTSPRPRRDGAGAALGVGVLLLRPPRGGEQEGRATHAEHQHDEQALQTGEVDLELAVDRPTPAPMPATAVAATARFNTYS